MSSKSATLPAPPPLGVIDTLTAGIAVVRRHPWLLLLPILFDLFLWFTPPLGLDPALVARLTAPLDPQGANAAILTPEMVQELTALHEGIRAQGGRVNLWSYAASPFLFWPTVLAGQVQPGNHATATVWHLSSLAGVGGVALLLMAVGLLVNVAWLNGVARGLRPEGGSLALPTFGALLLRQCLRLALIAVAVAIAFLAALFPLSFLIAIVTLLAPGLGTFLSSFVALGSLWGVLWLCVHLYFTPAAVVMAGQGVWQAPWLSVTLVRRFFMSALGFIGLCTLLTWGFQLVWAALGSSAIGRVVGIVGNAALGSALTAAMFIFFTQRAALLRQEAAAREAARTA